MKRDNLLYINLLFYCLHSARSGKEMVVKNGRCQGKYLFAACLGIRFWHLWKRIQRWIRVLDLVLLSGWWCLHNGWACLDSWIDLRLPCRTLHTSPTTFKASLSSSTGPLATFPSIGGRIIGHPCLNLFADSFQHVALPPSSTSSAWTRMPVQTTQSTPEGGHSEKPRTGRLLRWTSSRKPPKSLSLILSITFLAHSRSNRSGGNWSKTTAAGDSVAGSTASSACILLLSWIGEASWQWKRCLECRESLWCLSQHGYGKR